MYLFSIPDSGAVWLANKALMSLVNEKSDWLYDDFRVDVAYGCPPSCIWNGNRVEFGEKCGQDWYDGVVAFYKYHKVDYRLNFTNFLLRPEHLQDAYGNEIAENVSKMGGRVMVSTPMMADYIKKNYPDLVIGWSTTSDYGTTKEERIAKINELSKDSVVVLPYDFNNKPELVQFTHPENLEILLNDNCIDNCSKRRDHNILNNKINLGECSLKDYKPCLWDWQSGSKEQFGKSTHVVGRSKLAGYAAQKMIRFKISGRSSLEETTAAYIYYLLKPGHEDDFYNLVDRMYREELVMSGQAGISVFMKPLVNRRLCKDYIAFLVKWGGLPLEK